MSEVSKISLRRVERTFPMSGGRGHPMRALSAIDLEIRNGEFVGIVGPSGCGKTTLLNIIAGFEQPSAGEAICSGRKITEPGPDRLVVFQEQALFPWLTVHDNITYGPRIAKKSCERYERLVSHLIAVMGLRGFEKHLPVQLSGGMKQRVAIARVLVMEPEVLLMDEPFGALDAQNRSLMQELLLKVWDEFQNTVVFVTHDVDEALFLCDTIYVMTARPGRIKMRIDVRLLRPRLFDVVTSEEFIKMKRDVLDLIRDETLRAASQEVS